MVYQHKLSSNNPHSLNNKMRYLVYPQETGFLIGKIKVNDLEVYRKTNNFLDFGCGAGNIMNIMKKNGWKTEGIDINPDAIRMAKEKYGFKIREDLKKFQDNYFDVVVMNDVLEHLYYPRKIINEIYRILRKGGIFLANTVNINAWVVKLFGTGFGRNFTAHSHYNHFSMKSIRLLFKKFKIEKIYTRGDELSFTTLLDFYIYPLLYQSKRKPKLYLKRIHNIIKYPDYPLRAICRLFNGGAFIFIKAVK